MAHQLIVVVGKWSSWFDVFLDGLSARLVVALAAQVSPLASFDR
jgi:hypothetical protein